MAMPPAYHESLPYIDPEPSQEALAAARALIAAEQSTFSPPPPQETPKNHPSRPPSPPNSPASPPQPPLNPSTSPATKPKSFPLHPKHQPAHPKNSHGRNAWLLSNYHLEAELRSLERDLAATKRDMDLLNAARASRQNDVKAEMQGLEQNWREGVGRVLETEIAVQELREQIRQELRSRASAAEHPAAL
ncbi:hypothetical protein TrVFT333_005680 [Trichoderma virens FT-333]|nr:hypothetical protein TrVFT333_005680 [Trichoderma virens FT-333]